MKMVTMRLPEEIIEELDALAKLQHTNRSSLIKRALLSYLEEQKDEGLKEKAVELYLEGKLSYKQLELLVGKEDARAVKASKELLEKGAELAERLVEGRG